MQRDPSHTDLEMTVTSVLPTLGLRFLVSVLQCNDGTADPRSLLAPLSEVGGVLERIPPLSLFVVRSDEDVHASESRLFPSGTASLH